jgi:hypothetical protein
MVVVAEVTAAEAVVTIVVVVFCDYIGAHGHSNTGGGGGGCYYY